LKDAKKANTSGKGDESTKEGDGKGSQNSQDYCQLCAKKVNGLEESKAIKCCRCKRVYHSTCHEPPLNTDLVKRFPWECPDCKACKVCSLNNEEDKIIICDMCDKAVHIHCLNPPLEHIPQHNWFCKDCVNCVSCDKHLGNITLKNQGLWYDNIFRICKDCNLQFQQGNFCKICCKVSSEDSSESFVQCDECEHWIHARCDNIDAAKLAKLESNLEEKYVCPLCRKKRKNNEKSGKKK
jgi:hypothetical protein